MGCLKELVAQLTWRRLSPIIGLSFFLVACKGGQVPDLPGMPRLPNTYVGQPSDASTTLLPNPNGSWWKSFGNDELNQLLAATQLNNHDLRIAIARINQAEAQAGVAGADRYPSLDAFVKSNAYAPSGGAGSAVNGVKYTPQRLESFGLRLSYETDFWGRSYSATDAALELAKASRYYREVVWLTLTGEVTKTYIDYLTAVDRVRVAERTMEDMKKTLKAVESHVSHGDATEIDAIQQATAVSVAQSNLAAQKLNRDKARNALAALLGTTPSELSLSGDSLDSLTLPDFSAGVPAQLICRRPDIRRAEAIMRSAHADIKVARSKLYPTLTFSVEAGRGANYFNTLGDNVARYYNLLGEITQSIFDGGRIQANIDSSNGRYREMVETYDQTIHEAVHDVEDALAGLRWTSEQWLALKDAVASSGRAHALTTVTYERGAVDYLTMLEAERSMNNSLDSELVSRSNRFKASVDLMKAIGGSVNREDCTSPTDEK